METQVQTNSGKHPDFKHLEFTLNPESHYYQMTRGEMGFTKVPPELKLEETQKKGLIRSDFLIRGRIKDGKYLFFTGLLQTNYKDWYFGDYYEVRHGIKKNSFILFHFSPDLVSFQMYFFNLIKVYPDHRERFIHEFINSFKK
jgi:hypothetical protein